jgi:hypothetical protein
MRVGVAQRVHVSPVLFSLYTNYIPTPIRHVELAQYAADTALAATSRILSLLVGYLEAYLGRLERWLRDWWIVINVPKCSAVLFVKAVRRIQKPRAVKLLGDPIQWVVTARYLGVTVDTQLTWSAQANQVGMKAAQRLGVLGPSLTGEAACPSEMVRCSTSSSSVLRWITHVRSGGPLPAPTSGSCRYYNPSVFALRLTHIGTLVTGKFTKIRGSILRRPHHSTDWEFRLKVSWCGEALSSAKWKAPVPTKGWLNSPTGNRGGLMFSRPAEAVHKNSTKSAQRLVSNYSATLTEVFRAFPQL